MAKIKELTGLRFGRLEVIGPTAQRKNRFVVWECRCDCGNSVFIPGTYLTGGRTRSCGCLRKENLARTYQDLNGQRFGHLVAVRPTEKRKNNYVVWECLCDCGATVHVRSNSLLQGTTKSCGCLWRETLTKTRRDLAGQRFGRLVAVRATEERKNSCVVWECLCDCGVTVYIPSNRLLQGITKSCGCIRREKAAQLNKKDVF